MFLATSDDPDAAVQRDLPHLPAAWPRCPSCGNPLIRLATNTWACGVEPPAPMYANESI
jgi:hypothetical protein